MDDADALLLAVGTLLREFHVNERAFPIAEGRISYSPHVFAAMGYVAQHPGAKASDLATFLGLRPTTASSLIARLASRGLIEKTAHPEDGRAVALSLSAEGEDLFRAIRRQDLRNMELMLSALSKGERAAFVDMMSRVAHKVAEAAKDGS
ncbi:MarR family winged helix-turn-helix transcriptional regulator [Hasllibacter sp. MH4015]|uniref:MarR family winged helix-turn-helix transcriptional regulator n=1 Tax=Hasllibacter sp. MH4015 TaxID=2854029 RepID=UPI001CD3900A|nr:MarR family transcriptional regulator [Hasllibacter sp. MH4015]